MTISSATRKAGPFLGNGATTAFPFTFKVFKKQDVAVTYTDANGVDTNLILDSNYTVALNGDQNSNPGGTVTYPIVGTPLPTGAKLTLTGDLAYTQPTDLPNLGPFFAEVVEDAFDRAEIQIQQVKEITDRSIKISVSDTPLNPLPSALGRANTVIGFDALGNVTVLPLPASVGAGDRVTYRLLAGVDFTAGVSTSVTLPRAPGSPGNIEVHFDGVPQDFAQWTVAGTTLTFAQPIPAYITEVWGYIGTTLSTQIPPAGSVGDSQILWGTILARQVVSVAEMQTLDVSKYQRAWVAGYYGPATLGGGLLCYDAADNTTPANNGTVFTSSTGPGRWKRPPRGYATLCEFGCIGDGATDDSVRAQACIDAMKGQRVVRDAGKVFFVAGLTLSGSTYNFTTIEGEGRWKLKPDGGNSTFGGAWVGLLIKDTVNVTSEPNWDGNRLAMTQREQIFCEGIAGAIGTRWRKPRFFETRGDCMYHGQSNWQASSANPRDTYIEYTLHSNDVPDGRNTLSVIAATGLHFEGCMARNSGGFVNGFYQPGGVDVEPDFGYQSCTDIYIGPCDITTGGTHGVGVVGKSISGVDANRDWNCSDITFDDFKVLKTGTAGSAILSGSFTRVADLKISGTLSYDSTRGEGFTLDFAQRVKADLKLTNVTFGLFLGRVDSLTDFDINAHINNYQQSAIRSTGTVRGRVRGRVYGAVGGGDPYAVQCHSEGRGGLTQTDVIYEVDAPYDGLVVRAFRNEPGALITFGAGCMVQNCDWSGYANQGATNDAAIRTQGVLGWNNATAVPTSGTWFTGDFVRNDAPAQGSGKIKIGWVRLNSGSNNVLNNDWSEAFCTIA